MELYGAGQNILQDVVMTNGVKTTERWPRSDYRNEGRPAERRVDDNVKLADRR